MGIYYSFSLDHTNKCVKEPAASAKKSAYADLYVRSAIIAYIV